MKTYEKSAKEKTAAIPMKTRRGVGIPRKVIRRDCRFWGFRSGSRGGADPLTDGDDESRGEELAAGLSERERDFHRGRQSVTEGDESLAFPRGVRKLAGEDLHE